MVTVIRTAVTVNASKKADKKAADITNNKDRSILDLMVCNNLVKITHKIEMKFIHFLLYIPNHTTYIVNNEHKVDC